MSRRHSFVVVCFVAGYLFTQESSMRTIRYCPLLLVFFVAVLNTAYSQTALQLVPITPCRLLDTRSGQPLMGGQTLPVQIAGACGIPTSAQAYSFNVTVVPHGSLNY